MKTRVLRYRNLSSIRNTYGIEIDSLYHVFFINKYNKFKNKVNLVRTCCRYNFYTCVVPERIGFKLAGNWNDTISIISFLFVVALEVTSQTNNTSFKLILCFPNLYISLELIHLVSNFCQVTNQISNCTCISSINGHPKFGFTNDRTIHILSEWLMERKNDSPASSSFDSPASSSFDL